MLKSNTLVAGIFLALPFSLSSTATAGIYQCIDENGNRYFTETKAKCKNPGEAVKIGSSPRKESSARVPARSANHSSSEIPFRYSYTGEAIEMK